MEVWETKESEEALVDLINFDRRDSGAVAHGCSGLGNSGTGDTL